VVTFHGALPIPDLEQEMAFEVKILICHGALDSFIPEATIQKVRAAFEDAKLDYESNYYGGAIHSFTVHEANKVGMKGMAYNTEADRPNPRSGQSQIGRSHSEEAIGRSSQSTSNSNPLGWNREMIRASEMPTRLPLLTITAGERAFRLTFLCSVDTCQGTTAS
jgi:hypothetical protein